MRKRAPLFISPELRIALQAVAETMRREGTTMRAAAIADALESIAQGEIPAACQALREAEVTA